MKSKKGLTEADWAMSMGIFILYLVWLFVVIRPTFSPETKISIPFDDLKDSFFDDASWTLNKTPLIIRSNITGNNEPIIVDFPFTGIKQSYNVQDKFMVIDEGRLFFLANLEKKGNKNAQLHYLLHSESNYSQPNITSDLASSEQSVSTKDLTVNYNNGMIQQAFFRHGIRIMHYSITVGGNPIGDSNTHKSNSLFSKHKIISPELNHSSYIIVNNSRIYNFFDSARDQRVSVGIRTDTYPNFYINEQTGGKIIYNQTDCNTYTTDYIDLYDNLYGLSFIFDDDVSLELCHRNNLSVTATFDVSGRFGYQLIFHDISFDTKKMTQPYKLIYGAEEVLQGLSDQKLFNLEKANYSDKKINWSYPFEFNITVLNATNDPIFSFGKIPSKYETISAETHNFRKLDKKGNVEKVSVVLLSW